MVGDYQEQEEVLFFGEEVVTPLSVSPLSNYHLLLTFSDQPDKKYVFDCRDEINRIPPLWPLKDQNFFESVYIDGTTVCWNGDLDICPEILVEERVPYEEWLKRQKVKK